MKTGARTVPAGARAHIETCESCSGFAGRLLAAEEVLGEPRAEHLPDDWFAARVRNSLPDNAQLVGLAAMRFLPATLALTLVLSVWCWLATPGPGSLFEQSPTDDLLAWTLEDDSP